MESKAENKSQLAKFKEAARELETDDREAAFDEKLAKVAKSGITDANRSRDSQIKKPDKAGL